MWMAVSVLAAPPLMQSGGGLCQSVRFRHPMLGPECRGRALLLSICSPSSAAGGEQASREAGALRGHTRCGGRPIHVPQRTREHRGASQLLTASRHRRGGHPKWEPPCLINGQIIETPASTHRRQDCPPLGSQVYPQKLGIAAAGQSAAGHAFRPAQQIRYRRIQRVRYVHQKDATQGQAAILAAAPVGDREAPAEPRLELIGCRFDRGGISAGQVDLDARHGEVDRCRRSAITPGLRRQAADTGHGGEGLQILGRQRQRVLVIVAHWNAPRRCQPCPFGEAKFTQEVREQGRRVMDPLAGDIEGLPHGPGFVRSDGCRENLAMAQEMLPSSTSVTLPGATFCCDMPPLNLAARDYSADLRPGRMAYLDRNGLRGARGYRRTGHPVYDPPSARSWSQIRLDWYRISGWFDSMSERAAWSVAVSGGNHFSRSGSSARNARRRSAQRGDKKPIQDIVTDSLAAARTRFGNTASPSLITVSDWPELNGAWPEICRLDGTIIRP